MVAVVALSGCGPRAAPVIVPANETSTPTAPPACGPVARVGSGAGTIAPVAVTPVAGGTAVPVAPQTGAPTPRPRSTLVAEAVATATAVARVPTPTAVPASTPLPQASVPQAPCGTATGERPTTVAVRPPAPTTAPAPAPTGPTQQAGPSFATATPVAMLSSPSVLLASDSGSLVLLHVGERLVLLLGQYTGTDWGVQLSDPSVLQRVGDDGQGVYQASKPGETELTAIGDPACLRAPLACARPSWVLRFTVRVQ